MRALTLLQTYFMPILISLESKAQKVPNSLRIHVLLIQTEFMILMFSCLGVMIFIGIRFWTPYRVERFETGFGYM